MGLSKNLPLNLNLRRRGATGLLLQFLALARSLDLSIRLTGKHPPVRTDSVRGHHHLLTWLTIRYFLIGHILREQIFIPYL